MMLGEHWGMPFGKSPAIITKYIELFQKMMYNLIVGETGLTPQMRTSVGAYYDLFKPCVKMYGRTPPVLDPHHQRAPRGAV